MKTTFNASLPAVAIPKVSKKDGIMKRKKKAAGFVVKEEAFQSSRNELKDKVALKGSNVGSPKLSKKQKKLVKAQKSGISNVLSLETNDIQAEPKVGSKKPFESKQPVITSKAINQTSGATETPVLSKNQKKQLKKKKLREALSQSGTTKNVTEEAPHSKQALNCNNSNLSMKKKKEKFTTRSIEPTIGSIPKKDKSSTDFQVSKPIQSSLIPKTAPIPSLTTTVGMKQKMKKTKVSLNDESVSTNATQGSKVSVALSPRDSSELSKAKKKAISKASKASALLMKQMQTSTNKPSNGNMSVDSMETIKSFKKKRVLAKLAQPKSADEDFVSITSNKSSKFSKNKAFANSLETEVDTSLAADKVKTISMSKKQKKALVNQNQPTLPKKDTVLASEMNNVSNVPKKRSGLLKTQSLSMVKIEHGEMLSDKATASSGVLGKRKRQTSQQVPNSNLDSKEPPFKKTKQALLPHVVEKVASAVLKLVKESQDPSNLLFSESSSIFMHFILFKIPKTPFRRIRCDLPHSVLPPDPDVCLIVPDIVKGRRTDVELSDVSETYSQLLQERGAFAVKEVMPFARLKAEYGPFEMKRRLAKSFDLFLCDGRIQGHVVNFLGKIFEKAKKVPIPIKAMDDDVGPGKTAFVTDLKDRVKRAINRVYFTLHGHGSSYAVQIGHSSHSAKQLTENILKMWDKIHASMPGGVQNIRTVYLKGQSTVGIPLFASLVPIKNVPVAQSVKRKPLQGELSTHLGKKVIVYPTGDIKVVSNPTQDEREFSKRVDEVDKASKKKKKQKDQQTEDEETVEADSTSGEDQSDEDFTADVSTVKKEPASSGEDSDDDGDVDDAENAYLSGLQN